MIPYGKQSLNDRDIQAVTEVLESDYLTQGDTITAFEQKLTETFSCDYAVAVSNGTMALELTYKALGVENERVLTTPNTFVATSNAIIRNGGYPDFVDINPTTFNLSATKLRNHLDELVGHESVAGITPVHFAGLPCKMEHFSQIAKRHDLFLLEDACHAPGAEWRDSEDNWIMVGSCEYSDAAIMSFHPVKHFTTGEGGAVLTNDQKFAENVRMLRTHGITKDTDKLSSSDGDWYYEMQELGTNARITDFQCALGISQLDRFEDFLSERRAQARRYREAFKDLEPVTCQKTPEESKHAYHLFTIRVPDRDQLYDHLIENNVSPQVHYIPVHTQPYYQKNLDYQSGQFPEAESYYREALSIPLYPSLTPDQQTYVIDLISGFYR